MTRLLNGSIYAAKLKETADRLHSVQVVSTQAQAQVRDPPHLAVGDVVKLPSHEAPAIENHSDVKLILYALERILSPSHLATSQLQAGLASFSDISKSYSDPAVAERAQDWYKLETARAFVTSQFLAAAPTTLAPFVSSTVKAAAFGSHEAHVGLGDCLTKLMEPLTVLFERVNRRIKKACLKPEDVLAAFNAHAGSVQSESSSKVSTKAFGEQQVVVKHAALRINRAGGRLSSNQKRLITKFVVSVLTSGEFVTEIIPVAPALYNTWCDLSHQSIPKGELCTQMVAFSPSTTPIILTFSRTLGYHTTAAVCSKTAKHFKDQQMDCEEIDISPDLDADTKTTQEGKNCVRETPLASPTQSLAPPPTPATTPRPPNSKMDGTPPDSPLRTGDDDLFDQDDGGNTLQSSLLKKPKAPTPVAIPRAAFIPSFSISAADSKNKQKRVSQKPPVKKVEDDEEEELDHNDDPEGLALAKQFINGQRWSNAEGPRVQELKARRNFLASNLIDDQASESKKKKKRSSREEQDSEQEEEDEDEEGAEEGEAEEDAFVKPVPAQDHVVLIKSTTCQLPENIAVIYSPLVKAIAAVTQAPGFEFNNSSKIRTYLSKVNKSNVDEFYEYLVTEYRRSNQVSPQEASGIAPRLVALVQDLCVDTRLLADKEGEFTHSVIGESAVGFRFKSLPTAAYIAIVASHEGPRTFKCAWRSSFSDHEDIVRELDHPIFKFLIQILFEAAPEACSIDLFKLANELNYNKNDLKHEQSSEVDDEPTKPVKVEKREDSPKPPKKRKAEEITPDPPKKKERPAEPEAPSKPKTSTTVRDEVAQKASDVKKKLKFEKDPIVSSEDDEVPPPPPTKRLKKPEPEPEVDNDDIFDDAD
jgi:hypothetical protein